MNIRITATVFACSFLLNVSFAQNVDATQSEHMANFYAGQIAEARGEYETARALYREAANQYEDLEAQELADNALLLLSFPDADARAQHVLAARSYLYLSSKAKGVNGLVDPNDTTAVDATDTAIDMMLAGNLNLLSYDSTRISIGGHVFREDYMDYSEFDLQLLGATFQVDRVFGNNLLKLQSGYSTVTLGGDDYLSYTDVALSDTIILNDKWDLKVSGMFRQVSSDSAEFDHYDGDAVSIGFEFKGREDNPWRLDYAWRRSDAADDYVEFTNEAGDVFDGFLSYSRDSHRIRGRYEREWSDNLSQSFSASLRKTEYHDPNLFLEFIDDTSLTEILREGTRYSIGTEISWSVNDRLRILGDIEFYDEDSNIDEYDFDSLQIGIGVDYFF
jgi:hypothetical protein